MDKSNVYLYFLYSNVFSNLQSKSLLHYKSFFQELTKIETHFAIDNSIRKFITSPFAAIEYLGMKVSERPKPNTIQLNYNPTILNPVQSFVDFSENAFFYFEEIIDDYYNQILEKNRTRISPASDEEIKFSVQPFFWELWDSLVTKEIERADFKNDLLTALWWDFITDWRNNTTNRMEKTDIAEINSYVLNIGMEKLYSGSINLLRTIRIFHNLVSLKENPSLDQAKVDKIEFHRETLLGNSFKTASKDLVDTDITQFSITGYKKNEKVVPVITFTTDQSKTNEGRIRLFKDVIGVYYNKTIKPSDKTAIENFKQGLVVQLNPFKEDKPFYVEEILYSTEVNKSWLEKF